MIGWAVRSAGAPWLASAFAARLPAAMLPVPMILFGQSSTGSYAQAGLMGLGLAVGSALAAPLVGSLADRHGHRVALATMTALGVGSLAGLVVLGQQRSPLAALVALAVLVGCSNAQVGPMARAAWSARFADAPGRGSVERAMAYETVVDELSYVLGPTVSITVAVLVAPAASLAVIATVMVLAQGHFAWMVTRSRLAIPPRRPGSVRAVIALWFLVTLLAGATFGTMQALLTSRLEATPHVGLTGVIYSCLGVGCAATSLWLAGVRRGSLPLRVVVGGAALAATGLALGGVRAEPVALTAAFLLVGACLAPLLVSSFTAAERISSAGSALGATLLAAGQVVGVGLGTAAGGWVVEAAGSGAASSLPVAIGVVVVGLGIVAHVGRMHHVTRNGPRATGSRDRPVGPVPDTSS